MMSMPILLLRGCYIELMALVAFLYLLEITFLHSAVSGSVSGRGRCP